MDTMTWQTALAAEKEKEYFKKILAFIKAEREVGKTIYPPTQDVFNAIKLTSFDNVKVVIIGQDPYHGPDQAHGLAFSVRKGVAPPPSLKNIFQELHADLKIPIPNHGSLEKWAEQGVLLLNAVLTVEAKKPASHSHIGWQIFTDKIIETLNAHDKGIIFLLWGAYAQSKIPLITNSKHHILKAAHPSPFSVRGFSGCRHFSKANALLREMGLGEIDWSL